MNFEATPEEILSTALRLASDTEGVCILDSCGVGRPGLGRLIAGLEPVKTVQYFQYEDDLLGSIEQLVRSTGFAAVFTLSYDLGREILKIGGRTSEREPLAFVSLFDSLLVHDYATGKSRLAGEPRKLGSTKDLVRRHSAPLRPAQPSSAQAVSNFTKDAYITAIEQIVEEIRKGNTYQTNLTQQITVELPTGMSAADVFLRLRRDHPAPFAAFIQRGDSTVVSASPERLVRVENGAISASPIKGTSRRGGDPVEDDNLRRRLAESEKDRAENTMIVDLLRNDLGRICEYGSVRVTDLCSIEEHPTLFHMVSTIEGKLRPEIGFGDMLRSVFPCGSITGAPKISTMKIIDRIETLPRGLSMGSIGISIPDGFAGIGPFTDLNVAIRTMVVTGKKAVFNVGGGIVIDSDPEKEYDESLLKARSLLTALGAKLK
ncbi:MAG TPA: anthranilate synthase component I family protein [Pyrinomonadaceae bacterium]|nr:anthranilate synthase component I family protein [Pyrinomonadaceae bacterium]HMP66375.1 anthranilate synthase component I family protein [Pyrinomonadaceae bacterium]